jgi:hypothetical protein
LELLRSSKNRLESLANARFAPFGTRLAATAVSRFMDFAGIVNPSFCESLPARHHGTPENQCPPPRRRQLILINDPGKIDCRADQAQ